MLAASIVMAALLQNVHAAEPAPQRRDRFSIGASFGPVLIMPSVLPAARVSLPVSRVLAIDFDVASSLSWGTQDRDFGQVADGLSIGGQLRWARHGRKPDGTSRYWLLGPHVARGTEFSPGARREYPIKSVQFGYGVDATEGRWRVGSELSVSIAGDGYALVRIVLARRM